MYHDSSAAVSIRFGITLTFDASSAVLQWKANLHHFSILLFAYILRQSRVDEDGITLKPANSFGYPAVAMSVLAYADYVAITSGSAPGAERTLHRLQLHSVTVGLMLNAAKTEDPQVGYESHPE